LGSSAAFGIARILGMKFVEKIVKKEYVTKFNCFVTRKGLYILSSFSHSRPSQGLPLLFVPPDTYGFLDFFLVKLIGRLPGTLMLTFQGTAVKDAKYLTFFIMLVISVFSVFSPYNYAKVY
jgi:uncharacterized membrane protein YdjX (TVP38/TMEM64 family)